MKNIDYYLLQDREGVYNHIIKVSWNLKSSKEICMEIGQKVEAVNHPNEDRNCMKGIVSQIFPAGMFAEFAIIQVDFGNGHHGQFTQDQLK
jgi:hypothetical protein